MAHSSFMGALKRGERILTARTLALEKTLLGQDPTVENAEAWDRYVWTLYVLTMVCQANGSAPASIAASLAETALLERYRPRGAPAPARPPRGA
jgi:hypothetical protein